MSAVLLPISSLIFAHSGAGMPLWLEISLLTVALIAMLFRWWKS